MNSNETTNAVAYLRRSTDRQEQSISDQRTEIARWAAEHGYKVGREYIDDAISGTSAEERPAFQQMIADAGRGGFKAVVVWNSDRFSRGDVTETEHYRFLLRQAGVKLLSVTEDYLARDGIDGDVLRTVKQFQNRQFSISLSQNTLRGQISSIMAESDPGRAAPYGYDREIVAPDGSVMYRIKFCPGRVREVYDKDGKLQARYEQGQSLRKPGKQCKARLVLSEPKRVQVVKEIFRKCLNGVGFASIAADLNARGISAPCRDHWNFTSVKALLENPTYFGSLVWNRRTEAKFYRLQNGRTEQRQRQVGEAKVIKTAKKDWIVIPNAVPAIVSEKEWDKAQLMVSRRRRAMGGAGHRDRRWLLTGVLECGDCGHKYWGGPKRKGRIEGRAPVVTNYYTCAGRRSHGKTICATASSLRAEQIESWVLDKLQGLVAFDTKAVDAAIERFVESALNSTSSTSDTDRIGREIKEIRETISALTTHIDPANLSVLNGRLTQYRLRLECLENELQAAQRERTHPDAMSLRTWAQAQFTDLQAAMAGTRNDRTRDVVATYIDRIIIWPSQKRGELRLNPFSYALWQRDSENCPKRDGAIRLESPYKRPHRQDRRSWVNAIGATGFEPATSCSQSRRATGLRHAPCVGFRIENAVFRLVF